jgi:uncharacterized protein
VARADPSDGRDETLRARPARQALPPGERRPAACPAVTSRPGCTRRRQRSKRKAGGSGDGCDGCESGCDAISLFSLLWLALPAALVTPAPAGTPWAARWPVRLVVAYRARVSPARPPCCPFTPTCSTYGLDALRTHGLLRGGRLTVARLRRCRPGAGGSDPVPAPVRAASRALVQA